MRILALADDLTGALEIGAKFAEVGLDSLVTTELTLEPTEVLVIDTETRHAAAGEAAARVGALARAARERGVELVYKKTDSTLRGNIGAEIGALFEAYGGASVMYAPAYPQMGRTVKGGVLYVNGVPVSETAFGADALNPVRSSFIPDVIAAGWSGPVRTGQEACPTKEPAVYVHDGESAADLRAAAQVVTELAVGPAAFAGEIARLLLPGGKREIRWPAAADSVVVNGSRHAVSVEQVRHAVESGWRCIEAGEPVSGWVVLRCGGAEGALDFASRMGDAVRDTLKRARLDAVVVFGGDTAWGVLKALGFPALRPLGEVLPGVPVSRFELDGRALHLVTKAGGFGPPDLLCALRAKLCGSSTR